MVPFPATTPDGPLDREPVAILLTGLAAVVDAGIVTAGVLDWVHLTGEQTTSIVGFVTIVTGFVGAVLRSRVWSPTSHAIVVNEVRVEGA